MFHSCEIKNQIIKLRIIFVIHNLVIQLLRIKKILWSYDFDLADSYDLMICMTGFFVIQYKKTRDPMIPTWKNSWSCDLEMSITRDPVIPKRRKFVILWSRNLENSWSHDLKMQQLHDLVISESRKKWSHDLRIDYFVISLSLRLYRMEDNCKSRIAIS